MHKPLLKSVMAMLAVFPALAHGAGTGAGTTDLVTTTQDLAVQLDVLANDTGFAYPATVSIVTPPGHGGAVVGGSPGSPGTVLVTYTPATAFKGTDAFVYSVSEVATPANSSTATVTVTVLADTDHDGVADIRDNCTLVSNGSQLDTDGDGYGNLCDADINNSGTVTSADFGLMRSVLGQASGSSATAAASDMNGSGTVTSADFGLLRARLGTTPGPSGLRPTSNTFTVEGTVSQLIGTGLVMRNNGGDNLTVAANGPFAFATGLASGAAYAVTVLTQPSNPSQTCVVTGGSGTLANGSLPNIGVTCTTLTINVGGAVSGRIAGSALTLQNNGTDAVTMFGNGSFSFPTALKSGAKYNVTLGPPPRAFDQSCVIPNGGGAGTVGSEATITVTCTTNGKFYYAVNSATNTVSIYNLNSDTGVLTLVGNPVSTVAGPTWVEADGTGRFAYVTSAGTNPGANPGAVSFYKLDPESGALTLGRTIATGKYPRHITLDRTSTFAWVPNYGDNTVSAYRIGSDGFLAAAGPPVATGVGPDDVDIATTTDPAGTLVNVYAYVTVSGGNIWTYTIRADGTLVPVTNGIVYTGTNTPPILVIP